MICQKQQKQVLVVSRNEGRAQGFLGGFTIKTSKGQNLVDPIDMISKSRKATFKGRW